MPDSARLTVDDLARTAGTTTRSVRNYQSLGLLRPPEVVGRVGYYGEGHLARLRLIARLQDQGFSLGGIRALIQAWEEGQGLAELLGFEQALTAPWTDEQPETYGAQELVALFPAAGSDPGLALRSVELGLVEPVEDGFRIPSPRLLRVGADMVAAGIPLEATLDELVALRADMERVAARFVALFEDHVWRPFLDDGAPPERLPEVTQSLRRLRPLAAVSVEVLLARAMESASASSTAANAALLRGLEHGHREVGT